MIDELKHAIVSYTGNSVTVLFRDRDKTGTQIKSALSHRLDVPVQFIFQTSSQIRVEWWYHGICYNPYGAAIVVDDQTRHQETYHNSKGIVGCDYGPAEITHIFRKSYREKWMPSPHFNYHRDGGPAIIEIDYATPPEIAWGTWDSHREPIKAKYKDCFKDDDIVTHIDRREFMWYKKGKLLRNSSWAHQVDQNIVERIDVTSTFNVMRTTIIEIRELRWYDEGVALHRTDGPARVILKNVKEAEKDNKHGKWKYGEWEGTWYIHGQEVSNLSIIKWARKNHIRMWNDACYDKSAFRDAGDEFCFLTDFVGAMK